MLEDDDEDELDAMGFSGLSVAENITKAFANCGWKPDEPTVMVPAVVSPVTAPCATTLPPAKTVSSPVAAVIKSTKTFTEISECATLMQRLRKWNRDSLPDNQENKLWKGVVLGALTYLSIPPQMGKCQRAKSAVVSFWDNAIPYRGVLRFMQRPQ